MNTGILVLLAAVVGLAVVAGLLWRWVQFRITGPSAILSGIQAGILAFLVWDLLSTAYRPLNDVVSRLRDGQDDSLPVWLDVAAFIAGLLLGFVVLAFLDTRSRRPPGPARPEPVALQAAVAVGWTSLCVGLAMGASKAVGSDWLTVLMVVGWVVLNGFAGAAVLAPYAAARLRPDVARAVVLGAIGGVPAVIGALLGGLASDDAGQVACLCLPAGAGLVLLIRLFATSGEVGGSAGPEATVPLGRSDRVVGYTTALVTLVTMIVGFVASVLVTLGGVGA